MNSKFRIIKLLPVAIFAFLASVAATNGEALAEAFSVSPMSEKISLVAGQTYYGSLTVTNPGTNEDDFSYTAAVQPFTVSDSEFGVELGESNQYTDLANWITITNGEGIIRPNESRKILFTINIPDDAPAGGEYAAITVKSVDSGENSTGGLNIGQQIQIAHLIYVDIAGNTIHDGEILGATLQNFLFSGNIKASVTAKNNGNVHGDIKTTLQVFPLFSNEEIFTNEEEPQMNIVLPGTSRFVSTEWPNTPSMGIFNVVYTAEFEGVTTQVKKMVIVCPLWLLFVIIFGVILIIIWLVSKNKSRKKK